MINEELIGMDKTHSPNANIFHYEGSLFIIVSSNAIIDVHYMIDVSKPLKYMGSFKTVLGVNAYNIKLTAFIDKNIEIMMRKQEGEESND